MRVVLLELLAMATVATTMVVGDATPGTCATTDLWLVRHGARHDYAVPEWRQAIAALGHEVRDPPLSALGWRQAQETAANVFAPLANTGEGPDLLLVSPFLRVIQTATPTAHALGLPLHIEDGLAEIHYVPGRLPDAGARFQYFPHIETQYEPIYRPPATPGEIDESTGMPCETYPRGYLERVHAFAPLLEEAVKGRRVAMFSHAASIALVAALLDKPLEEVGNFAPCGVFHLRKEGDGAWVLLSNGGDNTGHVSENHHSTFPWGFGNDPTSIRIWGELRG